jgi:poly(A) polymerase
MFKGGKIIEVSTFRKKGEEEENEIGTSLLIKRDNTFGTPAEDAFRRDFTVNALYYNIADFTIIDYVGGIADLQNRLIRSVGDPNIRFQEDPIRILRGIRLTATLDFHVEQRTWRAMTRHRHHILECPASRIREEIMKILRRGNTHRTFQMLAKTGILEILFPKVNDYLESSNGPESARSNPFWEHLAVLDNRRSQGVDFDDPLLLAALTAAPVMASFEALPATHDVGGWLQSYLEENFKKFAIPRVVRNEVHLLHLALRHMLAPKRKKRRRSLRRSTLFSQALKLLEIHCEATQQHRSVLHRWQRPQTNPRVHRSGRKHQIPPAERRP